MLRRGIEVHAWFMSLCVLEQGPILGCYLHPHATTLHDPSFCGCAIWTHYTSSPPHNLVSLPKRESPNSPDHLARMSALVLVDLFRAGLLHDDIVPAWLLATQSSWKGRREGWYI